MLKRVLYLTDNLCKDCYLIANKFVGDANSLYYSLPDKINKKNHTMFVWEDNGFTCGFLTAYVMCGNAYVENLYVDKNCQRRGIGAQLISVYEQIARKQGARHIVLQSRNTVQALRFYKKMGFEKIAENMFVGKKL